MGARKNITSKEAGRLIDALQKKIDELVGELEHTHPDELNYRGVNMAPAIKKKLYFRYIAFIDQSCEIFDDDFKVKLYSTSQNQGLAVRLSRWFRGILRFVLPVRVKAFTKNTTLLFADTQKHKSYATKALEYAPHSLVGTLRLLSLNKWILSPKKKDAGDWLYSQHYDLLLMADLYHIVYDKLQPKTVLFVEGNKPEDYIGAAIAKAHNVHSVCLQHGWAFTVHAGFKHLNYDKFLSWGGPFSQVLSEHNSELNVIDAGHPTLEAASMIGLKNKRCVSFICQGPFGWIGNDTHAQFIETIYTMCSMSWEVLVRQHPSWPMDRKTIDKLIGAGAKIVDNQKVTLDKQLTKSQFAIIVYSSVGFECYLKQCVPIFALFNMDIELNPAVNTSPNIIFRTQETLVAQFNELDKSEAMLDEFIEGALNSHPKFHAALGDEARRNIEKAIASVEQ